MARRLQMPLLKATQPNYRIHNGLYVLHRGDTPIGTPCEEVALGLDTLAGVLHKHGPATIVQVWADAERDMLQAKGPAYLEQANSVVVISGRFPLGLLNDCVDFPQQAGSLYRKVMSGNLKPEPFSRENADTYKTF